MKTVENKQITRLLHIPNVLADASRRLVLICYPEFKYLRSLVSETAKYRAKGYNIVKISSGCLLIPRILKDASGYYASNGVNVDLL